MRKRLAPEHFSRPPCASMIERQIDRPIPIPLALVDSGPGLAPETLERLFDAFYTIVGKRELAPRRRFSIHRACRSRAVIYPKRVSAPVPSNYCINFSPLYTPRPAPQPKITRAPVRTGPTAGGKRIRTAGPTCDRDAD
jgi:hypothetical protein